MIAYVEGTVRIIRPSSLVIDVAGIGYEVFVSDPYKYKSGRLVFLYTYHQIREDSQILFGFDEEIDYEIFIKLLNVKGIGAKTAMAMLARTPGKEIAQAVQEGNVKLLKSMPGIGPKSASQIVLDLQGKLVSYMQPEEVETDPVWQQTKEALEALGYNPKTIQSIKKELQEKEYDGVDTMLRHALMLMAQRKER
ncbi:Holliday junction branch migration protein RuvA [uncultured Dubosiella sp.]|uniref:Holliday junction branch migration protein RuvA n=1 Tax=uncultured Dubosiella sp. TaxID=1937011 RepID=UPI0020868662|nr:Holliday junction branch migration protein RuvA [uncultured Dubosiella sp.]GJM58171.1 Holliday junction ATP-dependent DNA helicase RuvA [Erysipelotrichaceae bacterium OPF54]